MQNCSHKSIFIRTDANEKIASGHVMRCLALADALKQFNMDVIFVVSDKNPNSVIEMRGYSVITLESDWRDLTDGMQHFKEICRACDETPVVVVDTYSISSTFVNGLSEVAKVCYLGSKIGDLGDLSLLINYSTKIDEYYYKATYARKGTKLLLGAKYAPLSNNFANRNIKSNNDISKVLVTTGNTDSRGFVPYFLKCVLKEQELNSLSYEVVVGAMFDHLEEIRRVADSKESINLNYKVRDMARLMDQCDVAVSANGTTVYELAAMGIATISFAMVDEQVASAKSLSELGAIKYAGLLSNDMDSVVSQAIRSLKEFVLNPAEARNVAKTAHELIDGKGACRIAKEIALL